MRGVRGPAHDSRCGNDGAAQQVHTCGRSDVPGDLVRRTHFPSYDPQERIFKDSAVPAFVITVADDAAVSCASMFSSVWTAFIYLCICPFDSQLAQVVSGSGVSPGTGCLRPTDRPGTPRTHRAPR